MTGGPGRPPDRPGDRRSLPGRLGSALSANRGGNVPDTMDGSPRPGTATHPPRRVRVVLAGERRVRPAPARLEITEQTPVGEALVRGLIRAQLGLAVRLSLFVVAVFGLLPVLFALDPGIARVRLAGLELPWLLLGVLAYPVVLGVAWAYVRLAERNEQEFSELVDRS